MLSGKKVSSVYLAVLRHTAGATRSQRAAGGVVAAAATALAAREEEKRLRVALT